MKKNAISLLIIAGALSISSSVYAASNGTEYDGLTWTLDDNGVLTVGGTSTIRSSTEYDSVPWYYNPSEIKTLIVEPGVKAIERFAFDDCENIEQIILPDSLVSVGLGVFKDTVYFNDESNWENGVLYAGKHLLSADKNLSGSYTVKDGTICIADRAFYQCKSLTEIIIPDGVNAVGSGAFYYCVTLSDITIPDSVQYIFDSAFYDTAYYKNQDNWDNKVLYINNHLISANTSISGDYEIKPGTLSIAELAFDSCRELSNIIFNTELKIIGDSAFFGCDSLTAVTIPENIEVIGNGIFKHCSNLKTAVLPDTVSEIGHGMFSNCESLVHATLPKNIDTIPDSTFECCTSLSDFKIPEGITSIGEFAFCDCASLNNLVIPQSVKEIKPFAFMINDSLTDIYYCGSNDEWNNITIALSNEALLNAQVHFNHIPYSPFRFIAQYCDGRLIEVRSEEYTSEEEYIEKSEYADTIKVMVWNNMIPIYSVKVLK